MVQVRTNKKQNTKIRVRPPQVTTESYSRHNNQTAAILVFGKACNEEIVYNNLTMNSQKIGLQLDQCQKAMNFLLQNQLAN